MERVPIFFRSLDHRNKSPGCHLLYFYQMINSSLFWLNYIFNYFCLKLEAWLYYQMLCNFTHVIHLFNSEAQSVISSVAGRRKRQNNYFFNIQVLIMIHKSICIQGGFVFYGLWASGWPPLISLWMENLDTWVCQGDFYFSLFLKTDV